MRLQATDPDLETLVARISRDDIDLQPDFQRGEIWPIAKKRKLIDSILRGWHVPPIHLVVREGGVQEVLDGQQRLAAIRDFTDNEFAVEGTIEPYDETVAKLDGLKFRDLPDDVRRGFNSFTVRTFLLTDYKPEEPGELFFRLNQVATLTSAEQRNAFFGAARDQVREVVAYISSEIGEGVIGFSNKRMAYDDVVSKFLLHCERGEIAIKTSANELSQRFRDARPFDPTSVDAAKQTLRSIFPASTARDGGLRLNKASLLSGMLFSYRALSADLAPHEISDFFTTFLLHASRRSGSHSDRTVGGSLVRLFVDRSSFRVADVSSVVARDFALWASLVESTGIAPTVLGQHDSQLLVRGVDLLMRSSADEQDLEHLIASLVGWGSLNAQD